MGCCFLTSRIRPAIEVIDTIDPSKHFDCLRPKGKLVYKIVDIYNVPRIDIYFEDWYPNNVRLWQKYNSARQHFLIIKRTPLTKDSPLLREMKVTLIQFIKFFILSKKKDG